MKNFIKKLKSKIGLYHSISDTYNGTYPSVKNDIIQSLYARHCSNDPKNLIKDFFISFLTYYKDKQYIDLLFKIVEDIYPEYLNLLNTIILLK